jgi:ERCC4-type nuclease
MIATLERKTFENLVASLSDGTLAFQMQRLGEVARAAVVVEGRYSALFKLEHVPSAFIADGLARLQVPYPRDSGGLRRLTEVRRGCSKGSANEVA